VPHEFVGLTIHYRKSWLKEIGLEKFPGTFDELHAAGKKLKANGHPLGQCLGHSLNDPNVWCYPMMWAYGGQEVNEQGKVAINSPATIAAVAEMKRAWSEAYDETGLAWDDASNNRAFLASTISATLNGASIWWQARKDKWPQFEDIGHALMPTGPKGQYSQGVTWSYGIMKYSKNVDAAKAYLRWRMQDQIWMPWFEVGASFHSGVGAKQNNNPLWDKFEPVMRLYKETPVSARGIGSPGPANQKAGTALAKFIVVDMFAKAVQGDSPEAAVGWAEKELKAIYEA
jgi:multiple sugar transport system substrate-binding protein